MTTATKKAPAKSKGANKKQQILDLIAQGKKNAEIAEAVGCSVNYVSVTRTNGKSNGKAKSKGGKGTNNVVEAIRLARQLVGVAGSAEGAKSIIEALG